MPTYALVERVGGGCVPGVNTRQCQGTRQTPPQAHPPAFFQERKPAVSRPQSQTHTKTAWIMIQTHWRPGVLEASSILPDCRDECWEMGGCPGAPGLGTISQTATTSPLRLWTWEKIKDISVGSIHTEAGAKINTDSLLLRHGPRYTNGMFALVTRPGTRECWGIHVCFSKCLEKKPGQSRLQGLRHESQSLHLPQLGTCFGFPSCHVGIIVPTIPRLILRVGRDGILTIRERKTSEAKINIYPYPQSWRSPNLKKLLKCL